MLTYDPKDPGFFAQQVMLIGTTDPDGQPRFAPISWVSYTWGPPPCLVLSIWGTKRTKENISRTQVFSATLLTKELLPFAEQCAGHPGPGGEKTPPGFAPGRVLDVPLIENASYSFECRILHTTEVGESHTYLGEIAQINLSQEIASLEFFDLTKIQPVLYSPDHYFTVGEHLGKIGDFSQLTLCSHGASLPLVSME